MKTNLKKIRIEKRMTQSALAEKSGVSRVTINRIENEEMETTTIATLSKLSKALDSSLDEILISG